MDGQGDHSQLQLMTNWYATRIHIVGAELGRGSMSRFSSLCGTVYGDLVTADAARRSQHGWAPKAYSKLPLCRFCVRAWEKETGAEPDITGMLPADPSTPPKPRKVATRPWRVESMTPYRQQKWAVRTTVTTRERAVEELTYYAKHSDRPVRARNTQTGEIIE